MDLIQLVKLETFIINIIIIQFYVPFKLISAHMRRAKTGVPREKTSDTPASRTWLVSHVARAGLESAPVTAVKIGDFKGKQHLSRRMGKQTICISEKNVGKKVTGKKVTEKKSQIWVGKKVTGKKVTKIKNFFFYFMLEMDIIIFIITNIIENIFVWVDVLRPDYQFSSMPGWS